MFISFEYNTTTLSAIANNSEIRKGAYVNLNTFGVNLLKVIAIYNKPIYSIDILEKLKYMVDLITNKCIISNINSTYNIKFLIKNKYYDYSFTQNNSIIVEEKLVEWSDNNTYNVLYHSTDLHGGLYLSYAKNKNNNNIICRELTLSGKFFIIDIIYSWFLNLEFLSFLDIGFSDLIQYIDSCEDNKKMFIKLCNDFSFNIDDIKSNINGIYVYKNNIAFNLFTDESPGFQRFLSVLGLLLNRALLNKIPNLYDNSYQTYIINDFGLGLHPLLLSALVEFTYKFNNQLIFTTYDTLLMDVLRHDQMYINSKKLDRVSDFANIEKQSVSKLYLYNGI